MDQMEDPRPTLKLTTDTFLFAWQPRLDRFVDGAATSAELEAVEAIGGDPPEFTSDMMIAQISEYRANREQRKVLGTIRIMLAAVGYH